MGLKLHNISKVLIIIYFGNLLLYSFSSIFSFDYFEKIFWFIRIPILVVLYYTTSMKKQTLYFLALILYQLASILFATSNPAFFTWASISSLCFKVCLCFLVVDLVTKKIKIAVAVAMIPFFVLFLYVIDFVVLSLGDTYIIWILNTLLTSFIVGIAVIYYINNSDKKGYWLLISAILFVIQIAAFFVNKFYVKNEAIYQIVILSYGVSHFTFYKFLVIKEYERIPYHNN
ncbi:hypothetical protein SAMN05444363_2597 [Flavobacterium terrae]|uniref:YhhN-like protein n=2 Tax=Flavobacterium terrae TaxID=415425 RepID=A0A1M6GG48_9FLAO|nr:hypothetical protein SAMN05444363_2597 [Flavobacterium terrae]